MRTPPATQTSLNRFAITSEECELLLAFSQANGIDALAKTLHKDRSVISRMLSRIAVKQAVLEKRNGKWALTPLGHEINELSRDTLLKQRSLLSSRISLSLGTTREFGARVLAPRLQEIKSLAPRVFFHLKTFESGIESALHARTIDIGFDCGRPHDPEIAYRLCTREALIAVSTPHFFKKNRLLIQSQEYSKIPYLLCERISPDVWMGIPSHLQNLSAAFNDIASTRAACLSGLGWSLLPEYCVREDLKNLKLVAMGPRPTQTEHYGVWWRKSDRSSDPLAMKMIEWLKKIKL